ncbi:MAG: NDP-sugar synthase [Candidatus Aminicenantes bacterium]|nr:NDP-sugar synthase [Candidatus Aminicenantes bacterium]
MRFFILAAGYGKRAQPLSFVKPKPLFPLNGVPVVQILLQQLNKKGLKEGFINLFYKAQAIREVTGSSSGIEYLYEEELSGSKILKEAAAKIDDYLLVVNGDMFLEIPLQEMQQKIETSGYDGVLLLRRSQESGYPTVRLEDGIYAGRIKNGRQGMLMYTGAALFKIEALELIDEINFFDSFDKYRPRVGAVVYRGPWLDIGTPRSYLAADREYRAYVKAPGSNSLSKHVEISPGSEVEGSIIWENTVIRGGSKISGCIVTGDIVLEDADYRDKIISPGAGGRVSTFDIG